MVDDATDTDNMRSPKVAFLYGVLDDMIELYGSDDYVDDIARARREYDDRRGRVFEDEELWELWTQGFLEWYVVEGVTGATPPALAYLAERANDARRQAAVRAWLTSYRSLFEVRTLKEGQVELFDLLGGGIFSVAEPRAMHGVSIGHVAEMRVVGFEGDVLFGRTFCFHPEGTGQAILKHARRIYQQGGDRRDVIDYCASLRIRCERYRHVSPARIYETAVTQNPSGIIEIPQPDAAAGQNPADNE